MRKADFCHRLYPERARTHDCLRLKEKVSTNVKGVISWKTGFATHFWKLSCNNCLFGNLHGSTDTTSFKYDTSHIILMLIQYLFRLFQITASVKYTCTKRGVKVCLVRKFKLVPPTKKLQHLDLESISIYSDSKFATHCYKIENSK